jgi:hypothetical protein
MHPVGDCEKFGRFIAYFYERCKLNEFLVFCLSIHITGYGQFTNIVKNAVVVGNKSIHQK